MKRRAFLSATSLGALATSLPQASTVLAQTTQPFPSKPVRIIVPATAGSSDVFARAMAPRLAKLLGQPVIVEQKPGAGTNLGNDYVAKSAPDGHTILINGLPLVANRYLYSKLPYETERDLAPVIQVAEIANVITVHPSLGVNDLRGLIALAKSDPGKLNYGTPGAGSSGHLSAEMLQLKAGVRFTHVPYQGNAQATNDHLGGTLQIGFVNMPVGLQFVRTGKLRAVAVTSMKRFDQLPDVPTVNEALGMTDYELTGWFGLMVQSKTPPEIIARLEADVGAVLKDPSYIEVLRAAGADVIGGTRADFARRMQVESERLGDLIRRSGAKAD